MSFVVLTPILSLLCALPALAQGVALDETFDQGVPPPGWTQIQTNPLAAGWVASVDGRAWHKDESSAIGTCEDLLISPVFSLTGFPAVYAHFQIELAHPEYLANYPASAGDGETDLYVRVNGGAWVEAWTETRQIASNGILSVDLSAHVAGASGVQLALRYYGTFAHATWVDWMQVDGSSQPPPPPPPPPANWIVNLPTAFAPLAPGSTLSDGFEAYAGVLPPHMAATRVFPSSGLPDPESWCDIAGANSTPAGGSRCLEMGLMPGVTNYHFSRNALVIGYDATGSGGLNQLDFSVYNHGEEVHDFDGVWLSVDGLNWYQVFGPWTGLPAAWTLQSLDLRGMRTLTNGRFYLMFAQEDNFPFGNLDGLAIDSLELRTAGSTGPVLSQSGTCPGFKTFTVTNATPLGIVAFFYGRPGSFTQSDPNKPCLGLVLDLRTPVLATMRVASAAGVATAATPVSTPGCGLGVQAVDVASCRRTNRVIL
jgi:hypothetical protein